MTFPGARVSQSGNPAQRGVVTSVAQLLLASCAIVIVWEVGVRLTTTNSRTPTNISVHWTRCDAQDSGQSAGNSIEQALGDHSQLVPQVVPLAAQEDPVSDTSTEERVEPESIVPGAETVLPVPEEIWTNASRTWIGRPSKSVAEKRSCIRKFAGGTFPYEQRTFSQMFEDGIIKAIFDCLIPENKYFVEFGVETGEECTTRNLMVNEGWTGLLMDGSNQDASINLHQEFFTAENIADHFAKHSVPRHFDHLTIDIDQNTFWVLHSVLLAGFRPRCIVAEINRNLHPMDSFVVPYDAQKMWDGTNAFGASAGALTKLLYDFGYQLIAIDQDQINIYAVDSAEIGTERAISMEEVVAGVHGKRLCLPIHPCPLEPVVYLQVPENVSLAGPREEWYSELPLWSLRCTGSVDKLLFTGVQMDTPTNTSEQAIWNVPAVLVQPLPLNLFSTAPCDTVDAINSFVAAAQSPPEAADVSTDALAVAPSPLIVVPGAVPI